MCIVPQSIHVNLSLWANFWGDKIFFPNVLNMSSDFFVSGWLAQLGKAGILD